MITIRRIRSGEVELFKNLRLRALQDAPYAFSSTYEAALQRTDQSWQEQAERTARGADRATFFAFDEDIAVGMAALYRLEDQAQVGELLQVWVAPGQRGGQTARCLIDEVFAWASANHFCKSLPWCTGRTNGLFSFISDMAFHLWKCSTLQPWM